METETKILVSVAIIIFMAAVAIPKLEDEMNRIDACIDNMSRKHGN